MFALTHVNRIIANGVKATQWRGAERTVALSKWSTNGGSDVMATTGAATIANSGYGYGVGCDTVAMAGIRSGGYATGMADRVAMWVATGGGGGGLKRRNRSGSRL